MNNLLYINWDIDPVIFSLGPVKIQYYGLIFVTGLALCYYIIGHITRRRKFILLMQWRSFLYTQLLVFSEGQDLGTACFMILNIFLLI